MLFAGFRINRVEACANARTDADTRQRSKNAFGDGCVLNQQAVSGAVNCSADHVVFCFCLRGDKTHACISKKFFF